MRRVCLPARREKATHLQGVSVIRRRGLCSRAEGKVVCPCGRGLKGGLEFQGAFDVQGRLLVGRRGQAESSISPKQPLPPGGTVVLNALGLL